VCSWYAGPTLLEALQAIEQLPARRPTTGPLLARVMRLDSGALASPGGGDRPLAGFHNLHVRVLAGTMSAGDQLLALPNMVRAVVVHWKEQLKD
jgi:translation elongation factor EF-1alpha